MGPIPPKIVDAWHTKPPTLFLETNVFPARLPGMLSLDLATFERQPWPTPRVDTLDLSHCWEGKNIFLKLSGWGPLTITHDFRAARCTFWVLYKPKGRIWYIPLTITHDYSRLLTISLLQCVWSHFAMCSHNARTIIFSDVPYENTQQLYPMSQQIWKAVTVACATCDKKNTPSPHEQKRHQLELTSPPWTGETKILLPPVLSGTASAAPSSRASNHVEAASRPGSSRRAGQWFDFEPVWCWV